MPGSAPLRLGSVFMLPCHPGTRVSARIRDPEATRATVETAPWVPALAPWRSAGMTGRRHLLRRRLARRQHVISEAAAELRQVVELGRVGTNAGSC
jgi:hypothetical protein